MKKRLFIVLLLLVVGAGVYYLYDQRRQDVGAYSQLTGVKVDTDIAKRSVLAVMIENSREARPQTGLDAAGIVFEAVTEGGITRYLALYQENMPAEVGPVRSLRPHFLDWAMGFDASIAHVGGSPEALERLERRDDKSLNQFRYREPYERKDNRIAPHNLYASTGALRDLQREEGHDQSRFVEIPRSTDQPAESAAAKNIEIDFSGPLYAAEFRYDRASNAYTRYLAGETHIDEATDQPITVKNVVVVRTEPQRQGVDPIGSGEALVFKDGQVLTVRWQKPDYEERIKLTGGDGQEVPLNRGETWFAVVANDKQVTY